MNSNKKNAMATQTEQATVHATEVESINNGVNPQRRVMPDSNSNALKIEL
ncbi:hypothetical protein [Phocaeicola vulgatus]|nr:hypothetical protein [Phocaeicola vulgatus]